VRRISSPLHRKCFAFLVLLFMFGPCLYAIDALKTDAPKQGDPTDPKAKKTFAEAIDWLKHGDKRVAMDTFRKANKQDGGHCSECLRRAQTIANEIGAYKDAQDILRESLPQAATDQERAGLHFARFAARLKSCPFKTSTCSEIPSVPGWRLRDKD
jgi:thioredoxin-like negative regulator of GroEL